MNVRLNVNGSRVDVTIPSAAAQLVVRTDAQGVAGVEFQLDGVWHKASILDHPKTAIALEAVRQERLRQNEKWGAASIHLRSPEAGLAVLIEEVGEVAQCLNDHDRSVSAMRHLREELVQVAAVAVAMAEILPGPPFSGVQ